MINRKNQKGFSLIELLIVVAIILIIAAIAIPNLLRARMAANESSAVASIRTINTGMVTYNSTYPNSFAPSLTALGGAAPAVGTAAPCNAANLIDQTLGQDPATKSGYVFTYVGGAADTGDVASPGNPACGSLLTYTVSGEAVIV
jgi:prepilin-type N-terminal cleavage/methylation domain-containing protein